MSLDTQFGPVADDTAMPTSAAIVPGTAALGDLTATAESLLGQPDADRTQARLVVIDDEPINMILIEKCLRHDGYSQIQQHADSATAFDTIVRERPDVVLMDVGMPVSGLDILEQIRKDRTISHMPVIMVTASDDERTRQSALERGATDLLAKPIRPTELLPRVRNALVVKSHYDHLRAYAFELERKVRLRTAELLRSRIELIHCLARIAEYRDNETGRHVIRVGRYSGIIARGLQLDEDIVELIEHAAPLHDIGKIGVPDAILLKKDKLTPEEVEIMQRHVALGLRAFEPMTADEWRAFRSHTILGEMMMDMGTSPLLSMAAQIALTHHEHWDGGGYPLGLAGEEIPLPGRIVAVADVFDALSNKRPYKPHFPLEQCFRILEDGRGSQFDPQVVDTFLKCRDEIVQVRVALADID